MIVLTISCSRLLDLLLDVNNSAQIPPEKRIDLSLDPPSDDDALLLDIDGRPPAEPVPAKSYQKLLREVPHLPFSSAAERFPELLAEIEAGRDSPADPAQGQAHPPSFLTADDIDNYIWEIDVRSAGAGAGDETSSNNNSTSSKPDLLPTLAPLAHASGSATSGKDAQRDFALRNPTSVYNWLRKHAPKTFLQDAEHDKDKDHHLHPDDHPAPSSSRRKATASGGAAASERASSSAKGGSGAAGGGSARSKRVSKAAAAAAAAAAEGAYDDLDDELLGYAGGVATPSTLGGPATKSSGGGGKRKRVVDDDPGYRPKGGSSRPAKKKKIKEKEKGEGGGAAEGTPTAKRPKKSAAAQQSGGGDSAAAGEGKGSVGVSLGH
jgi:hypothetical protein